MYEITSGLYLADIEQADDPAEYGRNEIESVIQLTHCDPESGYPGDVEVYSYPMLDGPRNSRETMIDAVSKSVALLEEGEKVVVHCSTGESRSVGVCMAAVAAFRDVEFDQGWEVVEFVKPVRAHPGRVGGGGQRLFPRSKFHAVLTESAGNYRVRSYRSQWLIPPF